MKLSIALIAALITAFAITPGKGQNPVTATKEGINYDSIILRLWCEPHVMNQSFLFKKDGTFTEGGCDAEMRDGQIATGTYHLTGADGWLTFKDRHIEKIHITEAKGHYSLYIYTAKGTRRLLGGN